MTAWVEPCTQSQNVIHSSNEMEFHLMNLHTDDDEQFWLHFAVWCHWSALSLSLLGLPCNSLHCSQQFWRDEKESQPKEIDQFHCQCTWFMHNLCNKMCMHTESCWCMSWVQTEQPHANTRSRQQWCFCWDSPQRMPLTGQSTLLLTLPKCICSSRVDGCHSMAPITTKIVGVISCSLQCEKCYCTKWETAVKWPCHSHHCAHWDWVPFVVQLQRTGDSVICDQASNHCGNLWMLWLLCNFKALSLSEIRLMAKGGADGHINPPTIAGQWEENFWATKSVPCHGQALGAFSICWACLPGLGCCKIVNSCVVTNFRSAHGLFDWNNEHLPHSNDSCAALKCHDVWMHLTSDSLTAQMEFPNNIAWPKQPTSPSWCEASHALKETDTAFHLEEMVGQIVKLGLDWSELWCGVFVRTCTPWLLNTSNMLTKQIHATFEWRHLRTLNQQTSCTHSLRNTRGSYQFVVIRWIDWWRWSSFDTCFAP